MGPALAHVHISDNAPGRDCLPPGQGSFDFPRLFAQLRELSYQGAVILELYRNNFKDPEELVRSVALLRELCQ